MRNADALMHGPPSLTPTPQPATDCSPLSKLAVGRGLESLGRFMDRRLRGVPTGWAAVDKTLLGLGGLVILQGAPGSNKSTAALQIAHYNACLGRPALIVDEENGLERTRLRLLCQLAGASEMELQERRALRPPQWEALLEALARLPIYVASGVIDGPHDLEVLADLLVTQSAEFATLVVDSVQALPRIEVDERANLEAWLKRLDRLKLKYDGRLVILATSEKNYANFDHASMAGAKGSSAISYKGETILDFRSLSPTLVRVEVVKNRDGFRGAGWNMELHLSDPKNPASFTFQLTPQGELPG